ncbi:hypothetical protein HMI55_003710 [Coelomomyces lativittatus]|nr:hypothetical protein HMI55_003710 [Coelomomyces lativittatus]
MPSTESFILSKASLYTEFTMRPYSSESLTSSVSHSINTTRTSTTSTDPLFTLRTQLNQAHWTRKHLFDIVTHSYFNSFVLVIILMNTVALALQVSAYINANYGGWCK